MGARERVPVGLPDVRVRGEGRPPRGAEVGARERVPLDWRTCANAAEGDHFEVLRWARANGCPWDEEIRELAASNGYVETPTVVGSVERWDC